MPHFLVGELGVQHENFEGITDIQSKTATTYGFIFAKSNMPYTKINNNTIRQHEIDLS